MTGPFYFPRPPRPPGKGNPWVNPMNAACLIAAIALLFENEAVAIVFLILTFLCFVLAVFHERLQP
jgi:hypothetical protein